MEYQRVTAYLMKNLDKVDFPFIVFHSENDTMVDVDGSKALYAEASVRDLSVALLDFGCCLFIYLCYVLFQL